MSGREGLPLEAVDNIAVVRAHADGDGVTEPQRRLGTALQKLVLHGLDPALDDAGRDRLAAEIETLTEGLPPLGASRYTDDEQTAFFETNAPLINLRGGHPIFGQGNAVGIPVTIDVQPRMLVARFRFDSRQEGIPGWAHGGFVCAVFDYLLGQTCLASGTSGPTGTLSVRFEAPTPINLDLTFEGRLIELDGRKITAHGRIVDEVTGTVCASAEGLFIGGAW